MLYRKMWTLPLPEFETQLEALSSVYKMGTDRPGFRAAAVRSSVTTTFSVTQNQLQR